MEISVCAISLVIAFAFLLIVFVISFYFHQKRIADIKAIANKLGFSFSSTGDLSLVKNLSHFRLFSTGHFQKIRNLIKGNVEGQETIIFDYSYKPSIRTGKRRVWQQTVILLRSEDIDLPAFRLHPQNIFDLLSDKRNNIQHIENGYVLETKSKESIQNIPYLDIINYCKGQGNSTIEGYKNQLIYYQLFRLQNPSYIPKFLKKSLVILELLDGIGKD